MERVHARRSERRKKKMERKKKTKTTGDAREKKRGRNQGRRVRRNHARSIPRLTPKQTETNETYASPSALADDVRRKGEKRGGAGKANWGAPGDEIKEAELEKNEEVGEEGTAEEEETKEITLEDYEKMLLEKKAAINAAAAQPTEADLSAFEGLAVFEKKEEDENNPLSLTNARAMKGKQRAKALKEKETLIPNFKIEDKSYTPREKRQPGAGRGTGRGAGRGAGRGNGRGAGSAGRGGERPSRRPRDDVPSPLNDVAAFPTLGA